jgi:hypothetical protein
MALVGKSGPLLGYLHRMKRAGRGAVRRVQRVLPGKRNVFTTVHRLQAESARRARKAADIWSPTFSEDKAVRHWERHIKLRKTKQKVVARLDQQVRMIERAGRKGAGYGALGGAIAVGGYAAGTRVGMKRKQQSR